jgi:hypothetical protein
LYVFFTICDNPLIKFQGMNFHLFHLNKIWEKECTLKIEWPFPIGFGYKLVYIAGDQMVWSLHTTSRIKWWCFTLKCQSTKINQIPKRVIIKIRLSPFNSCHIHSFTIKSQLKFSAKFVLFFLIFFLSFLIYSWYSNLAKFSSRWWSLWLYDIFGN